MHVMLSTLYPQHLGDRREDQNTLDILTQYRAAPGDVRLSLFAGSAHPASVDHMRRLLGGLGVEHEIARVPYEYSLHHDSRRAHEIGFGKRWLAEQYRTREFDVLVFIDSDVFVSWPDIRYCIDLITTPTTYVRIPYVLRDTLRSPAETLGAFVHTKHAMDTMDYSASVYKTRARGDKIYRHDAPDCAIQRFLLRHGATKVRATNIETRHYTSPTRFGRWWDGRISKCEHMEDAVGFNPELSGAAIEPESVLALYEFCRDKCIRSAINLGTGTGNSLIAMLKAGVSSVVTVDQAEKYTQYCQRIVARICGNADGVTYLTRPQVAKKGSPYDLPPVGSPVDLVFVDGPAADPAGRLKSALQIPSRYYVFHDAKRDRRMVQQFVGSLMSSGQACQFREIRSGRWMAVVEVCQ